MPRIRRWFHVSHEINEDAEVWELTDTFGDWMLRVWLQMLSIGDRNEHLIKGDRRWIAEGLGRLWRGDARKLGGKYGVKTVERGLDWMGDKGWIRWEQGGIFIVKQSKYKYIRVDKQIPLGEQTAPPPILASPSLNGFYSLWSLYVGTKGSKSDALKAYKEVMPPDEAIGALEAQIAYKRECDKRGIFCENLPHVHRWIKKRRWEDEIPQLPLTQAERLWLEGQAEEEQHES